MKCEICGTKQATMRSSIEGTALSVCDGCGSYGKKLGPLVAAGFSPLIAQRRTPVAPAPEEAVVEGYGALIKTARERMGLSQEQLAQRIGEKMSILHKIETEHTEPSIALARKMERALSIHLIETEERASGPRAHSDTGASITIGDRIKVRRR